MFPKITWYLLLVPMLAFGNAEEQDTFNMELLKPFDGAIIHEIQIHGLYRTKEQAARWLFTLHEGEVFNSEKWIKGIHKLYDTTVLYNIVTRAHQASLEGQIDLDIEIEDRWPIMPYGIAQVGGGSNNFGLGLYDANFLGYFGQLSAQYSEFDRTSSYDFNYFQEFFMDTNYILGLDFSGVGTPVNLQADSGKSIGSFTWQRQQEQLLIGKKIEPDIRLFSFIETYRDTLVEDTQAPEVQVYDGRQYRVRPVVILGRSELTNFLEQGQEITFAPTSANFFDKVKQYSTLVLSYKKVFLLDNTNYALFVSAGVMTDAPIPYLFRIGGYDSVRGFSTNRGIGRYYLFNNLEYRPYVTRFSLPLIGQVVIQGCVFQDFGAMWNSDNLSQSRSVNSELSLLSHGIGLRFDFMRFAGAIVRLDFARTSSPNEGWGSSFGVGQFF